MIKMKRFSCLLISMLVTVTVSLSQHHPIAFEKEPYDVTVFQGQSLTLDCAVHSPTPYEVVWLKDSSIIKTYDSHRQLLMNNSLYIESFDESSSETDAGTYQCEARIKNVGSVMSRRATVVGRPGEVQNVTLHVSQDGNIFLPCYDDQLKLVDHRTVEWLKNGQKMNVKKYDEDDNELTYKENLTHLKHDNIIQHVDAQLEIVRAKFHHAGIYECMMYLHDDFKKVVKRLNLIVDLSKDPNKRENYNVSFFEVNARVGETIVLECLVDSHESGKFSWTKNDELIRFSEGKYEEHGRCSLYIKNVSSDDAAFYKLHVETSKRRYSKQTRLNVQSLPSFVEANAAVVEARVDEDVLLKCRVHAEPHPSLKWLKNGDVLMNNEYLQVTKTGDLHISNLFSSDAGLYQCVADNRLGNIQAITQLLVHNIEDYESNSAEIASDSLVSYVPHNVNVRATDSKSLLVTWQFSHFDRDSNHFLEFLVQHKRAGEDDLHKMITSKIDGHKRSLEINDLPRNSEWLVRMCAVVNNSTGMYTEWTSARTLQYDLNEMKQPGRLSSLNVQSTSTSLNISWTPPIDGTIKIRGYKLSYGVGMPGDDEIDIKSDQTSYTISNLEISTEYVISLKAYNKKGNGIPSFETIYTKDDEYSTDTPPPMSSPTALKSSASSSSSIHLSWSDISFKRLQKIKGTTDGRVYVVRFKSRLQGGYKYLNTTKLETVVQNLRPDTEYIFSVKVIIGKRQSSWSLNVVEKTKESAPTSAPTQLHFARNKDPTKVTLSWQPPTNPNGRITGYLVLYSEDVTLQDEHWKTKRVVGHTFSSTVDRLSANTKYYFKIQAVNAVGVGPVSLTALFKTTSDKIDGEKNTLLNQTLHQEEQSKVESSKEWPLLPMLMTIISLVLVLVIIVSIFVIIKVKRNKIVIQTKEVSDNPTSPDPSSGKSSLKPPDLWTHGEGNIREVHGNIDDFVNDHSSDDSSTAERWTLKSNHHLTEESKFKSLTLKQKTCTLMSNSSNVIPENDIQLSPALPSNSLLKSKYDFSKSHLSGPRVYVGDVANSTIGSRKFSATSNNPSTLMMNMNLTSINPQTSNHSNESSRMLPPLKLLSSPHLLLSSSIKPQLHHIDDRGLLKKKDSTEDLTEEMANIEGLMKDLNAIRQQNHFI